jgi:hypothetical protein
MSNKPILPDAYVDVNNRNLGLAPTAPSGVYAFAGVCQEGEATFDEIASIGNPNEVRTKIGFGELADVLLDFFNNGGKKAFAVPLDVTTAAVLGSVTKVAAGTSTGTITLSADSGKEPTNAFSLRVDITKTGTLATGKFKFSTDAGENYSPELTIPSGGTYVIPGTNIKITFVVGEGPVFFEAVDYHTATVTKPDSSDGDLEDAVDLLIASDYSFDGIVIASDVDASEAGTLKGKVEVAVASPDFRYTFLYMKPALSTSAANAITAATTIMAAIASDRVAIVTGEMKTNRPNHGDYQDRNVIGIVAGRRSALALSNDLGLFNAGTLNNVLEFRTGWTTSTIEDLDALKTITVRRFKGASGFRPTNGHMTDPFSDVKKDAWRLVLDKCSRIARLSALGYVKIDVDPSDVVGSTEALKNSIQGNIDAQVVGNREAVRANVVIPDGQNILLTEEIKVKIDVVPYGHASWIGIEIGLSNPLKVAS